MDVSASELFWEDRYNNLLKGYQELAAQIEEYDQTHMLLPVDADGVPILVGDELQTSEYDKRITCTGYCYQTEGYEKPRWSIAFEYDREHGTTEFASAMSCRHVKPDTIESVLEEFGNSVADQDTDFDLMTSVREYAERIRACKN